jgi:hypothetical protein
VNSPIGVVGCVATPTARLRGSLDDRVGQFSASACSTLHRFLAFLPAKADIYTRSGRVIKQRDRSRQGQSIEIRIGYFQ